MRYLHTAIITGTGVFPLDMLRYDSCWPHTQSDVDAIHASMTRETSTYHVYVQNTSALKDGLKAFTPERWKSFGASFAHYQTVKLS